MVYLDPVLTKKKIEEFIWFEAKKENPPYDLQRYKGCLMSLYDFLPEEKLLSKEALKEWRTDLNEKYSPATALNYVKVINRYLDHCGLSHIRFDKKHPKNISQEVFGYLTAIEPTEQRHRRDVIWKCQCKCGNIAYVAATRLITGNTLSCGCLNISYLKDSNMYIDGTSIRQALDDRVESKRAKSGYVGIFKKGTKWAAIITYKKKRYYLGCYFKLEDAIKARKKAKQLVIEDAEMLLEEYVSSNSVCQEKPSKKKIKEAKA